MLTFFTTAKPFVGHSAIIQRNALESWRRLDPDIEIILLGDDSGAAEICRELNLRYEPKIERKENGTKTVRSVFARAFQNVRAKFEKFLMVGRRWDLDITQPLDFSHADWQKLLVDSARHKGY